MFYNANHSIHVQPKILDFSITRMNKVFILKKSLKSDMHKIINLQNRTPTNLIYLNP